MITVSDGRRGTGRRLTEHPESKVRPLRRFVRGEDILRSLPLRHPIEHDRRDRNSKRRAQLYAATYQHSVVAVDGGEESYLGHSLEDRTGERLLVRERDLRDKQRACGEHKVCSDNGEDGRWEAERPVRPVRVDECEEQRCASGA